MPAPKEQTPSRNLACLAPLALMVSALLAAQAGAGLPTPLPAEEPLGADFSVSRFTGDVAVYGSGSTSLPDAPLWPASDPTGVGSASTTDYRYDDGNPGVLMWLTVDGEPAYEQEFAQRFRLSGKGTVAYVEVCFGRDAERDGGSSLPVGVAFYSDSAGRPGRMLGSYRVTFRNPDAGEAACERVDHAGIQRQELGAGNTWLAVQWQGSTGSGMVVGDRSVGSTKLSVRARRSSSSSWAAWQDLPADSRYRAEVFFIRLGVDHGGGPAPPPDPDDGCTPTTTLLQFDGGYEVSMCYRTPDGDVGQAKSGIWASGQSGLLWFFDRGNAEVLVKVLDGCSHNGYRWVFVAPVTTLEFNLWVKGPNGRRWTHGNRQGMTAAARSDTRAFSCNATGGGVNDFVVRGNDDDEVDLPHPLTDGNWVATLSYRTDDSRYSFWLNSHEDDSLEGLACRGFTCSGRHLTRQRFSVGSRRDISPGRSYVDPISAEGSWSIRFVKETGNSTLNEFSAESVREEVWESEFTHRQEVREQEAETSPAVR